MPLIALSVALLISYLSSRLDGLIHFNPALGQWGLIFIYPILSFTVMLVPLALFEFTYRYLLKKPIKLNFRGYLLMVVYLGTGQAIAWALAHGTHWLHIPVLVHINPNNLLEYFASGVCSLLVVDFVYYWIHRAQHSVPLLWQYHSQHHSIREINSYNCYHHVSEHIVDFATGIFIAMFVFGMASAPRYLAVYFSLIGLFNHSRINFFDFRKGRWLLGDPKFHLSHHLNIDKYINANFGGFTAIYDVVFKTYVKPDKMAFEGPYGVNNMENPNIFSIFKLWNNPKRH